MKEIHMAGGLKEFLRDMDERFGKKEGPSGAISIHKDIEEGTYKPLGFLCVVAVILSGLLATRPDGRDIFKMLGNLPIEIDVCKDRLTSAGNRLLREFEDHHLG